MKYSKITLKEYAEKFSDPFLRKAFPTIQYDFAPIPTIVLLIFLATLSTSDGGWPIGGSSALSKNIEKRYVELGGEITYDAKVKKIIVKDNVANGIQLENGSEHFSDLVISTNDGYSTIFGMLEGKYVNQQIRSYYDSYPKTQAFGLEVWYGIQKSFPNEPHAIVLFLEEPLIIEGKEKDRLDVEIFNFDQSLAPSGDTVFKVVFESNYDYWRDLSSNPEKYKAQKQQVADLVSQRLEKRFPGFSKQIKAIDVVTPISLVHWTGAYRGLQAWPAPKEYEKEINKNGVSKTLPGLQNFYMSGQWARGQIGLTTVCLTSRNLIREICKKDGKKFVASKPQTQET
jgi:phytoene dehydrogenase-like protein